jgi:YgiT-type zinc finger domain-containing protein
MKREKEPTFEKLSHDVATKLEAWSRDNPKATLTEIKIAVDQELAKLRRAIVEGVAQQRAAAEQTIYECPQCGTEMVRNGRKKRRLKAKGGQAIELERQQRRCLHCGMTLFPPG